MSRVLVLYPKELLSQSKFHRKVSRLTSQLDSVCLLYNFDHHGYVDQYASDIHNQVTAQPVLDIQSADIDYAIIFRDEEQFIDEIAVLTELNIPKRLVNIAVTRVVNIKREQQYEGQPNTPDYEYIGRGSYWGNPYSMYESNDDGKLDDRNEVIRKYKYDFDRDLFPNKDKSEAVKLKGKRLGCFCKPAACHGDVLADYLNGLDDGA